MTLQQTDSGNYFVFVSRQDAKNFESMLFIFGLAQNLSVYHHNCICGDNNFICNTFIKCVNLFLRNKNSNFGRAQAFGK